MLQLSAATLRESGHSLAALGVIRLCGEPMAAPDDPQAGHVQGSAARGAPNLAARVRMVCLNARALRYLV